MTRTVVTFALDALELGALAAFLALIACLASVYGG
jgi:hypothetical protein